MPLFQLIFFHSFALESCSFNAVIVSIINCLNNSLLSRKHPFLLSVYSIVCPFQNKEVNE